LESIYAEIMRFMEDYFPAYSQYGQTAETQHFMDRFYAPDLSFDDGLVTSREQWYKRCLAHPAVQDKLTIEHLFVDEIQKEVGALVKTQAIERASGAVLVELKLNVFYNIKIDKDKDIKIAKVKVFIEPNPPKIAKLAQLYMGGS
jgi:hypothetical protein